MTAPAVPNQKPVARREPREKPIVQRGGFYKAGNKQVPDAMRTQKEANQRNIPIEIIRTEQTEDYAEAIVRAWLPDHTQYTDDSVHHHFSVIRELKALEYLEKQVSGQPVYFRGSAIQMFQDLSQPFNKNGDPILTGVGYLKLLTEMARFKNFALRDAITKASRRAQLKLLNREWRDKEEIQAEKAEEKMVSESIQEQQQEKSKPKPRTRRNVSKKAESKSDGDVQDGEVTEIINIVTTFKDCPAGLKVGDLLLDEKVKPTAKNIRAKALSLKEQGIITGDEKQEIYKILQGK